MALDARQFDRRVKQASDEALAQFIEFHKTVSQVVFQMLVTDSRTVGLDYGSPVWTGRFRGSMTIAINKIDRTTLPKHPELRFINWPDEPESPFPNKPASEVRIALNGLKLGDTVYIANALPYSRVIERGHSNLKAPAGVFEVTVTAALPRLQQMAGTIAHVIRR